VLYTVDLHLRKPNMIFKSGSTENTIGTVGFPSLSSKIKTRVHDQDITLDVKMTFKTGFKREITYESPALQNSRLTWRSKSCFKVFDFECLDEMSVPLAKFTAHSSLTLTKAGRFDFFGSRASSGIVMDEVLVTGLALAYYTVIQTTVIDSAVVA
jgi:hypothetical protein